MSRWIIRGGWINLNRKRLPPTLCYRISNNREKRNLRQNNIIHLICERREQNNNDQWFKALLFIWLHDSDITTTSFVFLLLLLLLLLPLFIMPLPLLFPPSPFTSPKTAFEYVPIPNFIFFLTFFIFGSNYVFFSMRRWNRKRKQNPTLAILPCNSVTLFFVNTIERKDYCCFIYFSCVIDIGLVTWTVPWFVFGKCKIGREKKML